MGITVITCSGVSSTGKLTTQAGLVLMHRYPGKINQCIQVCRSAESIKNAAENSESILVIDGCRDCCGMKKIESLGLTPDMHIISTDCGILKRGTDDPSYDEIERIVSRVRKIIEKGCIT